VADAAVGIVSNVPFHDPRLAVADGGGGFGGWVVGYVIVREGIFSLSPKTVLKAIYESKHPYI